MKQGMKWLQLALIALIAVGSAGIFTGRSAVLRLGLTGEGAGWLIGYPRWIGGAAGVYAAVVVLAAAWVVLGRWTNALRREASQPFLRCLDVCAPLRLLPLLAAGRLLAVLPGAPGTIGSHAYFFGIPLVVALVLEKIAGEFRSGAAPGARARRIETAGIWSVGALLFAGYFALGMNIGGRLGETMGDEAHYLTMSRSLYLDGDLDVSNNLSQPLPTDPEKLSRSMEEQHLQFGADGRIYSFHPYGLPLLAFPFDQWGMAGRQAWLALLAAWASIGVYVLCRRCGAGIQASGSVLAMLAFSFGWAFYAIRYLPEILGCGLAAWAFWAVWAQRSFPLRATLVALAGCLCLPFAHARFAPPSILLAGAFCAEALGCAEESRRHRIARIGAFGLLYAAGGFLLLGLNLRMFGGILGSPSSAYTSSLFLSHPQYVWNALVDGRHICAAFPLAYVFFAAPAILWIRPEPRRRLVLWAGLIVAGILASSSATFATAGVCAPGRYQLMALPLLAPLVALALEGAPKCARAWFWFLGLLSVFLLAIACFHFERKTSVVVAAQFVRQILRLPAEAVPLIDAGQPPFDGALALASLSAVALLAVSFLAFGLRIRFRGVWIGCLLAAAACMAAAIQQKTEEGVEAVVQFGNRIRMEKYRWGRVPASAPAVPLLDAFSRRDPPEKRPLLVTTRPKEDVVRDPNVMVMSIHGIGSTDWKSRGWYWHLLHRPITVQHRGKLLFRVSGEMSGEAEAVFAFRHGPYTLDEGTVRRKSGPFDLLFVLPLGKGRGDLHPLVRFEGGDGDLRIDRVQYALFNDQMLADARFEYGPGEAVSIDPAKVLYEP